MTSAAPPPFSGTKEGENPLEFPASRAMYFRTTNEDVQSVGHQARVENWIRDFEKTRQTFVFPIKAINSFASCILVLGLLALIFQVASSSLRYAFVPSLLGSGIWIGLYCVATGAVGLAAAKHISNSMLLDFMVMTLIAAMLSSVVVILNSIGLEMYAKLCKTPSDGETIGVDAVNINVNGTMTSLSDSHWIGQCRQSSLVLMSCVVVLHVLLFITSAVCSAYICRTLNSSFNDRCPPLVVYHSNTLEMTKTRTSESPSHVVSEDNTMTEPKKQPDSDAAFLASVA